MGTQKQGDSFSASEFIDQKIATLDDWQGDILRSVRKLILQADPQVIEEVKWRGTPVWSRDGIICTGETYKDKIKLTFAKGASIDDPAGLFNNSLDGNARRAIDIAEGQKINATAFKKLIRAAIAVNAAGKAKAKAKTQEKGTEKPRQLSGGNPQIPKGDGDESVKAYIAAMPGWKSAVGAQLDALIVKAEPHVQKAVKWNSPFYGTEENGWFLGFHCLTKYVKVAFFKGAYLHPLPPGESKQKDVRYLNIYENDDIAKEQFINWIRQAQKIKPSN